MTLYIKNFQGISEATINLSGFTVLTGRSNSGKSSIRLALELALYNNWEPCYLKIGESHCVVKLTIDDDNYIQITKPENTYTVMVNGVKSVYPKVAKNQLEELSEFGLDYFYDSEGYYHNVHIRRQRDPWYYITYSNQEQSRIIASIFNFDEIKNILKKSYKDKSELVSNSENLAKDIDNLKVDITNYTGKLTCLQSIQSKTLNKETIIRHINLTETVNSIKKEVERKSIITNSINSCISNLNQANILNSFIEDTSNWFSAKGRLNEQQETLQSINEQLAIAEQIKANITKSSILNSYLQSCDKIDSGYKRLFIYDSAKEKVVEKLNLAKSLYAKINEHNIINYFNKISNFHYSLSEELKTKLEELQLLTKTKNSLVRYSSLSNYVKRLKTIHKAKNQVKALESKNKDIIQVIKSLESYKTLKVYASINSKIEDIKAGIVSKGLEVMAISREIASAKEKLDGLVACPHCNKPIGNFIKEHCNE
jgi:hypothetical protein